MHSAGANARNSMSLNRAPAPPSEATRGNASYIPFWPASFPDLVSQLPKQELLDTGEGDIIHCYFHKCLN